MGFAAPLEASSSASAGNEGKRRTHFANVFFFAALIFFVQGVMRLSVGDVKAGFLRHQGQASSAVARSVARHSRGLGHPLGQECFHTQTGCASVGRVAEGSLGDDDVCCLRGVVQRLDVQGRGIGSRGGRHGVAERVDREAGF